MVVGANGRIAGDLQLQIRAVCREWNRSFSWLFFDALFDRTFDFPYVGCLSSLLRNNRSLVKRGSVLNRTAHGIKHIAISRRLIHKTAFADFKRMPHLKSITLATVNLWTIPRFTTDEDRLNAVREESLGLLGPHGNVGLPRVSPTDSNTRKILKNVMVIFTARYTVRPQLHQDQVRMMTQSRLNGPKADEILVPGCTHRNKVSIDRR